MKCLRTFNPIASQFAKIELSLSTFSPLNNSFYKNQSRYEISGLILTHNFGLASWNIRQLKNL